ncbi:MAG: C4-dicarboxylate ABC transporter substrate-binding protein, partial [Pseudomonadota bacterium]|nr:C4-dicarboxylate ABC transporter substrate-binding protein [Pseudomonadota bacterium]
MPKIFDFTRFSLRDLFATAAPSVMLLVLLCVLTYWLADPAPPSHVRLSTGQANSAYDVFGKRYAAILARHHVTTTLQASLGSLENLQRLRAEPGTTEIGFVQSGSTEEDDAARQGLISLGSLFTEPVWLFYRETIPLTQLTQLRGLRVNVGPDGTG